MSLWGFQDRNTAGWWWWCCLYWGLNTIDLFHGSAICPFWSPRFSASLLCKKYSYWSCSRFRLFPSLYRPLKIIMLIFRSKHHGSFHGSNFSLFWSPRFSASFLCQKYSYWSCSSTFRFFPSLCRPFTNFLDLCCSTIYCATLTCETPTNWVFISYVSWVPANNHDWVFAVDSRNIDRNWGYRFQQCSRIMVLFVL